MAWGKDLNAQEQRREANLPYRREKQSPQKEPESRGFGHVKTQVRNREFTSLSKVTAPSTQGSMREAAGGLRGR